tara:strand:- start:879 stop:1142 length:264 start_codon:yes stop_codon:yes gene_type:complete
MNEQAIIKNLDTIDVNKYFPKDCDLISGEVWFYTCLEPVLFDRYGINRYKLLKKIGYIDYKNLNPNCKRLYINILTNLRKKFINEYN